MPDPSTSPSRGLGSGTLDIVVDELEGIDHDDQPVHIRIPGLMESYCGIRLSPGTHLPAEEVTDASWCADCDAVWSAIEA